MGAESRGWKITNQTLRGLSAKGEGLRVKSPQTAKGVDLAVEEKEIFKEKYEIHDCYSWKMIR